MELAFTGCLSEARSILRDAIEFAAHSHRMVTEKGLQKIWLNKYESKESTEKFRRAFERNKRDGLFKGLDELHDKWRQLSEIGSHSNIKSICDRFAKTESADQIEFQLIYSGGERRSWAISLFSMLLICFGMEHLFFFDYASRLKLDCELVAMRTNFESYKEWLRRELIARYQIEPPASKT